MIRKLTPVLSMSWRQGETCGLAPSETKQRPASLKLTAQTGIRVEDISEHIDSASGATRQKVGEVLWH